MVEVGRGAAPPARSRATRRADTETAAACGACPSRRCNNCLVARVDDVDGSVGGPAPIEPGAAST